MICRLRNRECFPPRTYYENCCTHHRVRQACPLKAIHNTFDRLTPLYFQVLARHTEAMIMSAGESLNVQTFPDGSEPFQTDYLSAIDHAHRVMDEIVAELRKTLKDSSTEVELLSKEAFKNTRKREILNQVEKLIIEGDGVNESIKAVSVRHSEPYGTIKRWRSEAKNGS